MIWLRPRGRARCSHFEPASKNQWVTSCEPVGGCQVLQRLFRDRSNPLAPGWPSRIRPVPWRSRLGDRGSAPAGRRTKTQVPPSALGDPRPAVLDCATSAVARLEACARDCEPRHSGRLASDCLPLVLALAILAPPRQTSNHPGTPHPNPAPGTGESQLGSAQDSRRTAEAWI